MKDVYLNFATLLDNGVCNDLQPHQVSVINKRQTVNDHVFNPNPPPLLAHSTNVACVC